MKLSKAQIETIAEKIHENYRVDYPGSRYDMPWDKLPDEIRRVNREQASAFIGHLEFLGLKCGKQKKGMEQLSSEHQETAASLIHEVWVRSKKADGWISGERRDDEKKQSPFLTDYNELPEGEKIKDRKIASCIVPLLNSIGISVFTPDI